MSIQTTTHLNFRGEARSALEFYRKAFGGDLVAVTYADTGNVPDGTAPDQLMWGQVLAPNGFHVMAYDVPGALTHQAGENSFFVSVRGETAEEIAGYWDGLAEEASVRVPLGPSGWTPAYGMLQDRFGVVWVLDVAVR